MKHYRRPIKETPENREAQRYIKRRALYSLAIMGESYVQNGDGKYLRLHFPGDSLDARTA